MTIRSPNSKLDWRYFLTVVAIAAVYFGAAKFGFLLAFATKQVTAVWPPMGFALVAYLLFGYRVWPGVFLGALLANASSDEQFVTAAGISVGNTLAGVVSLYLLRRFTQFDYSLERLPAIRDLVLFGAAAGAVVSASNGVAQLSRAGIVPWSLYGSVWWVWWIGDAMGVLLFAPLLLTSIRRHRPAYPRTSVRYIELAALFVTLSAVCEVALTGQIVSIPASFRLEYAIFPFITWSALRFGQREVAATILFIAGFAIWGAIHDQGPFAAGTLDQRLILLEIFLAVITITGLTLGATTAERKEADRALHLAHDGLELRVRKRTVELADTNQELARKNDEVEVVVSNLRASEERFRSSFDYAPVGMALVALDGRFAQVNSAFADFLGYFATELLTVNQSAVTHPDEAELELERSCLGRLLNRDAPVVQFEKRYRHHKGHRIIWALVSVSLLVEDDGTTYYLYQVHDLTESKEVQLKLEQLAYSDSLTGLANRARLSGDLDRLLAFAHRNKQYLGVAILDLDGFKQINDSLGHEAGDTLLKEIAKRLSSVVRETDCIARLGGDEFVLIFSELKHAETVLALAEKIRAAVSRPVQLDGRELVVTASLGVSIYPADGDNAKVLLRRADSALYVAKADGKNRVAFFRPEFGKVADERLDLENALRMAIDLDEFFIVYQPIIRLKDGTISGMEAFIRWRRFDKIVPPAAFIPIAEETGLILPTGAWVLRQACRFAAQWPLPLGLSVNCSARQLREDAFVDMVVDVLRETGLDPDRLWLELTESIMLRNDDAQLARLERLKALGLHLSIDDYGTGYSPLIHLKQYGADTLKIDAAFIQDIETDLDSATIVSATIAMAHNLGIEVIAEGVETQAQALSLQSLGCDKAQGFLYHRPMPDAEAMQLIGSIRFGETAPMEIAMQQYLAQAQVKVSGTLV